MPTYSELEEDYLYYSQVASNNVKTSAISGVAGVWIVTHPLKDSSSLLSAHHGIFAIAALLFISALFSDLLHNHVGAILTNRRLDEVRELLDGDMAARKIEDFPNPKWVTKPIWALYQLKVAAIFAASLTLIIGVALIA